MAGLATLDADPDVLWIKLRSALRAGRLDDAADAQRRLRDVGIEVVLRSLDVPRVDGHEVQS